MKKLLVFAMSMAALVACNNEKPMPVMPDGGQNDSLQRIIEQKDNEINEIMATLNEIQEGFREINEAEGRVSVAKAGERADKAQLIRENIQFISQRMAQNRELLKKLKEQLNGSTLKGDQLQKAIENLTQELQDKDTQLTQLRDELDKKDIHIAELDETIANLNTDVENLRTEGEQKTQTINTQDKQLNTAWYVFGTKKELKEQGVLNEGQVLRGNFNKNYFTKVDIRQFSDLKLYSKDVKLLTTHPSSSYQLVRDANKQYSLRISNPQLFWSTSKYLVVQVK
jgi:DNA repair exonuclease SbcCD ATPase subunit